MIYKLVKKKIHKMASASHVVNNKEKEVGGDKHPPTTPSVKGGGVGELRSLRGSDAQYSDSDDALPNYSEAPWKIISSYFENQHLKRLVRHQIESYNDFINIQIERTIGMFNPVMIASEQDFDKKTRRYKLEIEVKFDKFHLYRAQIHENNGATKLMFPQEARLRNFTYASTTVSQGAAEYSHWKNANHVEIVCLHFESIRSHQ